MTKGFYSLCCKGENAYKIIFLQALNFSLDGKLSLNDLSTALENELLVTKNGIQQAALASFKAEIRYLLWVKVSIIILFVDMKCKLNVLNMITVGLFSVFCHVCCSSLVRERVDIEVREKEKIQSDLEKAEKLNNQLATEMDEHHSAIEHTNNLNLRWFMPQNNIFTIIPSINNTITECKTTFLMGFRVVILIRLGILIDLWC